MKIHHLALAVRDEQASRHFYEHYFGFETTSERRYDDGVLMLRDNSGFALALGPIRDTDSTSSMPAFFHFGFTASNANEVHAIRAKLRADGIEIVEEYDEPDYVSVKARDPDGYVVEASWEP